VHSCRHVIFAREQALCKLTACTQLHFNIGQNQHRELQPPPPQKNL
jgi:hypothetical protein